MEASATVWGPQPQKYSYLLSITWMSVQPTNTDQTYRSRWGGDKNEARGPEQGQQRFQPAGQLRIKEAINLWTFNIIKF